MTIVGPLFSTTKHWFCFMIDLQELEIVVWDPRGVPKKGSNNRKLLHLMVEALKQMLDGMVDQDSGIDL